MIAIVNYQATAGLNHCQYWGKKWNKVSQAAFLKAQFPFDNTEKMLTLSKAQKQDPQAKPREFSTSIQSDLVAKMCCVWSEHCWQTWDKC